MQIVYVVRRYGLVGGMERYVWELANEISKLGFKVTVLCEKNYAVLTPDIQVIELGKVQPKPRWLSSFIFSNRVAKWLEQNPETERIIHSNERLYQHHITTVHGSPFTSIFEKPWWRLISLRVWMQLYLEKRELETAQYIIPVSNFISKKLAHYYPAFAHKLTKPIIPGVEKSYQVYQNTVPKDGGVIAFIGREWKRKGLLLAAEVVKELQITRPSLEFHVIGPDPDEIKHIFKTWKRGYKLMGWRTKEDYGHFDVLLHPATSEPYGMVISESLAMGVPVVISDVCGAAQSVDEHSGSILATTRPTDEWSQALDKQLSKTVPTPIFERSWHEVAKEHVAIYQRHINPHKTK